MKYVEYIETDGYCWFDTGIIPNINTRVEVDKITPVAEGGSYCCEGYIGAQNSDDSIDTFQIRQTGGYTDNKMWLRVGNKQIEPAITATTWTNVSLDKDNFTANGETFPVGTTSYGTCNYTLYISAIHNPAWNSSSIRFRASASQIGRVKVYESGVLVGDFVPAVDNNNNIGYYDEVSSTFKANLGTGTPVAGPDLSSISASASKSSLAATGETISIDVTCENAWTVTGNTFLTLSSTGDTGSTTITATAPSYSGATARTDTLTFTDSVTGDEAEITIKQKKYSAGQPVYLGGNEVTELYLGSTAITEAYLGDVQVYSSGPFVGLKISPKSISFNIGSLTGTCKVKSSESWTMTVPAWITASTLTGDTGKTVVTLSTTAQTAATAGTIEVTTANYSASASCEYSIGTPMLQIDGVADIPTQFSPYDAYTGNSNYLKYQISAEWTGNRSSDAYLYACQESVPFFSAERFRINDIPYCNIGNGLVSDGPENGGGLSHTWVVEVNNGSVVTYIDGVQTTTKTISGNWPTGNLAFAKYSANNLHINFYGVKFWGANDTLIADFAPDPSGGIIEKVSNIVYPKTGTGTTAYSLVINQ